VVLTAAFTDTSFYQPVALSHSPGGGAFWYVAEQDGDVWRFDDDADHQEQTLMLDIGHEIDTGSEMGLLGMAFHPDFADNGYMYLYYTAYEGWALKGRLSRFTLAEDGGSFLPGSETVLMDLAQPFTNHNGGQLAFGPDGYLYWGLGDGGSAGDPYGHGQDTDSVLGSILRLDVDVSSGVGIPADNPFADGSGGAAEIYAWGFRNPFAFHFDSATGDLWVGDVGQYAWEEVDFVERGGNYGWSIKEGFACYSVTPCDMIDLIDPIISYPNPGGASVVQGPVYRGDAIPSLRGTVLYADFYNSQISGIRWDGITGEAEATFLVSSPGHYFSAFGASNDGEVYVLSYFGDTIFKLVPGTGEPASTIPEQLVETGCVDADNPFEPAAGLVPYGVNSPFWSDDAAKDRWMALPEGGLVSVTSDGQLEFPVGTVLMKRFARDDQPLETRFMVRHEDGDWAGYSYAWSEDGTSAAYAAGGGSVETTDGHWGVPSGAQCLQCHTNVVGRTLGTELGQLTGDYLYPNGRTRDQLATLEHIGMFDFDVPSDVEPLYPADDDRVGVEVRARSVLHANCAGCHQPEGTGGGELDLRFSTHLEDMGLCNVAPSAGDFDISGAALLVPGDASSSILAVRMATRGLGQMPPIGTDHVDEVGLGVVESWINSIGGCP
jgi:uncharacterized repeat protein (TIGR03806 family)